MKQFSENAKAAFEIHGNKVILTKPYELTKDDWGLIMTRFNRLGYGLENVDQTIEVYEKLVIEGKKYGLGYILQPDQAEAVLRLLGKEPDELKVCVISEEVKHAALVEAKRYFNKGHDDFPLQFAGYLTTDGTFLNFSYDGHRRDIDHRDIYDAIECFIAPEKQSEYNAAMDFFMNCGNIRLTNNGIDLICEPTEQQVDKLYDYFEDLRIREQVIAVDYSNEDGHCVGSTSYDMTNIPVSTIIRDVKGYFKDYMIPIDQHLYEMSPCNHSLSGCIDKGFALEQEDDYERD